MTSIALDQINVYSRFRTDMGDIDGLAESIQRIGLLQPVVVAPDNQGYRLIAGARRLEAIRQTGGTSIAAHVITTLADARDLLLAERDENTCRKDFTPSEQIALGLELERLERPKALARKAAAGRSAAPGRPAERRAESAPLSNAETNGRVRQIVAPAVGMSKTRYSEAKTVVTTAESDPDPEVREVAEEAAKEMDTTGNVHGAFRRVQNARKARVSKSAEAIRDREKRLCEMAIDGHSSSQIATELGIGQIHVRRMANRLGVEIPADKVLGNAHRIDANRVMEQTVLSLASEAGALTVMNGRWNDLDPERLEEWATSLSNSLRSLNGFCKRLKEMAHA